MCIFEKNTWGKTFHTSNHMVSKSELQYYLETAHKNIEADKHVTTGQRLGVCLHEKPQLCIRNVIC